MNQTLDGPEHLPLPAPRGAARKVGGAPSAAAGIPIAHVVAVLTLALAGAGVWLAGTRGAPAAPASPRLAAPTPMMRAALPPAVPLLPPPPALEQARFAPPPAAAPKLETTALPEPPTADESLALAPRAEAIVPAQVPHLFSQPIVDFGQLERRIGYAAPRGGPAAGPAAAPRLAAGNQPHAAPQYAGARPRPSFSATARAYRGAASRGATTAESWRGSFTHEQSAAAPSAAAQSDPGPQFIVGQPSPAPQSIGGQPNAAPQPISAPPGFIPLPLVYIPMPTVPFAGAPVYDDEDLAEIRLYGHTID